MRSNRAGRFTYHGDAQAQALQLSGTNQLRDQRNRAYLCIALLLLCLAAACAAVWRLAQIHTVIPVVAVVDANGHVVRQTVVARETIAAQESVIQSQVHDFVTYCNTFDPAWRQHYADLCRLHASPAVAKRYDVETGPDNPDNPYYAIGQAGRRYPRITGITSLGNNAYQVAFQLMTEREGSAPTTEYYMARVQYAFTYRPLAVGDRWVNPLGFVATAYHKDQELARH